MVKRKTARKLREKADKEGFRSLENRPSTAGKPGSFSMPQFFIKALSVFLVIVLVISLTRYVMGTMPARGFWVLTGVLAVIAFLILPAMRKRFS